MEKLKRYLSLEKLLSQKSHFLFGARGTGKTTLIHDQLLSQIEFINLLDSDVFYRLSTEPKLFLNWVKESKHSWIVIDEIQRLPELLNGVHHAIETFNKKFLLTGSSARKLKQKNINLLGGRAWSQSLFPLTLQELSQVQSKSIQDLIQWGGLPFVLFSSSPALELQGYIQTYLIEEIQQEGVVREIPRFSRFLKTAALSNTEVLNFASIANDSGIPASTIREYFQILEDTLLGFQLQPWRSGKKRKAVSTAKFYFFDTGVARSLAGFKYFEPGTVEYGHAFEQVILNEVRAYQKYSQKLFEMAFWRTHTQEEVDLIIDSDVAIEIKATQSVTPNDLKGLKKIADEHTFKRRILVTFDAIAQTIDGIECMSYGQFITKLWQEELF